jgi:TRAP-type C4-dicarboxylate transport system permease small subunit
MIGDDATSSHPNVVARLVGVVALWLNRILAFVTVGLVLSFLVVALAAVFYRYVLNDSLVWTEEFVRYSLFWTIMLGAAMLSYENGHLLIEAIHNWVPLRVSRLLTVISHLLAITFCAILAWQGYSLLMRTTGTTPALRMPMRWVYAAMPVGGVAIIIMTLNSLLNPQERKTEELG